ncbi:MAG: dTMP kinase [Deltaproteobacteria bacterium]|nr:dTMP kinase [Deltaproteobacteria bacterium]
MSLFITFEGIEGSGKTTQLGHLTSYLADRKRPYLVTREPGGTEIGEQIRQILLSSASAGMEGMAELFLYLAARVQHFRQVIAPALREGKIVLCDRFFDATVAYQGYGRGLSLEWLEDLHRRALEGVKPDLTFLLDLPVEEGLKRAWKRMEEKAGPEDRFEKEPLDFHRRVREGYLALARKEPGRVIRLDGTKSEGVLQREVIARFSRTLEAEHVI